MPSTYTLNNGIELIGTGEQSGTWGDTTNTNLGLLDAALDGQVTVALASAGSSGSPNSLPITDGTASNGRNRMVVFSDSGDLGATAYVQLTPNDAEKIIYIRNSLSGSRSVILFQGTYNASNDYEVPAGTTAIVYFDGAGAGAVAANVFNNAYFDGLRLGSVSVTAILDEDNMASDSATALATQQSIKAYVDAQVGTVDTLAEILAIGNTTGGTDIVASTTDKVQFRDAAIYINSSVDGQLDIVADTEIQIAATTVDLNGNLDVSGTALVTGVLTTTAATVHTGGITMPDNAKAIFGAGSDFQLYHDGANNVIGVTTGNLYVQSNGGTILLQPTAGEEGISITPNSSVNLYYDSALKLATTATGIDVTGTVAAGAGTALLPSITTTGDLNTGMWFPAADTIAFSEGGVEALRINSSGYVGIGTTNPVSQFAVGAAGRRIEIDGGSVIRGFDRTASWAGIDFEASAYTFDCSTARMLDIAATGVIINEDGADADFRVESDTNANALFVEGSSGNVGIGTSSPLRKLHVASVGEGNGVSVSGSAPNISITNADTEPNTNTITSVFALATSAGNYSLNAGEAAWLGSGASRGNFIVNPNYSGAGVKNIILQPTSGNVGIGTTSPSYNLTVADSIQIFKAGAPMALNFGSASNNTFAKVEYDDSTGDLNLVQGRAYNLKFYTNEVERMRIESSGRLYLNQTAQFGNTPQRMGLKFDGDTEYGISLATTSDTGSAINFANAAGTQIGRISVSASATGYITSSDYRLKTDVQPMSGASDRVLALKPVNFAWIVSGDRVDGFLAHETQEVVPEAIDGTKDAMCDEEYEVTAAIAATYDEDGNELTAAVEAVMGTRSVPYYQGIDQSKLVPLLTAALQEALTKIADMEIRLSALEG
jgi:hypothetical protein